MDNKWHDENLIKSLKHGYEADVECYEDHVVKIYKPTYFECNEIFGRKGEAFYLQKYSSLYFPCLLECQKDFIVMPYYGEPISVSEINPSLKTSGINYLELVKWIDGLKKELINLQLIHRDINPFNILYDSKTNKYMLIDFGWMIGYSDINDESTRHPALNPYAANDEEAFDKISINAIQILLSRIGCGEYYDGSSVYPGWVYHPIPFSEFKAPVHKYAALNEYNDVLKFGELEDKQNLNILDIGCSIGYFSFKLAQLGHSITAIEADPNVWEAAEAMRIFKGFNNVNIINAKLNPEIVSNFNNFFDLTLMFNVHMWLYKQLEAEQTIYLMRQLSKKTRRLLFQSAGIDSAGICVVQEFKNNADIKIYLEKCEFKNVTHLRDTYDHGGIRGLFIANGNL